WRNQQGSNSRPLSIIPKSYKDCPIDNPRHLSSSRANINPFMNKVKPHYKRQESPNSRSKSTLLQNNKVHQIITQKSHRKQSYHKGNDGRNCLPRLIFSRTKFLFL